ncbi:MAG: formyltetrahydrofolate deformylase [Alphaproteobacteria bacterium]|nr:formyltetrahydrofolate deformylase [Alphaproteobacteria bacterium]
MSEVGIGPVAVPPAARASRRYILRLACPDRLGIVAAVAGLLTQLDCNILESHQFSDALTGHFFLRTEFATGPSAPSHEALMAAFAPTAQRFAMSWRIRDIAARARVLVLVSKAGHCLNDLLYRVSIGALAMDVLAVASNHPDQAARAAFYDVPFHHMPVGNANRAEQEAGILALVDETRADLVVLARYMQILSDGLSAKLAGRAINIHHSFLPGFKGAQPYHQAHARGVKLIGATAHYVTADLDEGPIIEQETVRVTHADTPERLAAIGRDLESLVLARAVRSHIEDRVLMHGNRTVVFT